MKKFNGKWLPESEDYKKICLKLLNDLKDFKRNNIYSYFVGNDLRSNSIANDFYNFIKLEYPTLLISDNINKFSCNDKIGAPNLYRIEKIIISPGTLRFMKVLGDVFKIDPKINKIIEIGSGYGGQALIFKKYNENIDYSIIDIPESLSLAKSYLKVNEVEVKSISIDSISLEDKYDLVISDYCLSELDYDEVKFYADNVISKCNYGYFTVNNNGESLEKLIYLLKKHFSFVDVSEEKPKTSHHKNHIIICKK